MRILFVSSTRIGDAVLSTGLLGHLMESFPGAKVTIACGPLPARIFAHAPGVDRVIALRKRPLAGHWLGLWANVAGTAWDLAVDLRGSALSWTLWAKNRRVFRRAEETLHRVEALGRFLDLDEPPAPRIWRSAKIWPADRFVDLATGITAHDGPLPDARVAVFGGPDERHIALPVPEAIPPRRCIDLVGGLDLPAVAACVKRCDLFVGNDSGLMHVAAATGTPTLGLFGPSQAVHYAPWGARCAVAETDMPYADLVGAPDFDHRTSGTLMTSLAVDRVLTAAQELLRRTQTAS